MSFRATVLAFIERCQQNDDIQLMTDELHKLGADIGLDRLIVLNLWQVTGDRLQPAISSTNFDPDVLEAYTRLKLPASDPVWLKAAISNQAFRWAETLDAARHSSVSRVADFYRDAGIVDGLTVPVFNERFERSLVSFTAQRPIELSDDEAALLILAIIVFRRSAAARALDNGPGGRRDILTVREREILLWTAAGKSAWEISTILDLSEKTVARHLLNIRGKLKASNTVQAVAEAIRHHEIVL